MPTEYMPVLPAKGLLCHMMRTYRPGRKQLCTQPLGCSTQQQLVVCLCIISFIPHQTWQASWRTIAEHDGMNNDKQGMDPLVRNVTGEGLYQCQGLLRI